MPWLLLLYLLSLSPIFARIMPFLYPGFRGYMLKSPGARPVSHLCPLFDSVVLIAIFFATIFPGSRSLVLLHSAVLQFPRTLLHDSCPNNLFFPRGGRRLRRSLQPFTNGIRGVSGDAVEGG